MGNETTISAVEIYASHRKLLANELKSFIESAPFADKTRIKALADKIDHMCNHIGSPSSVMPMLSAILRGPKRLYFQDSMQPRDESDIYKVNAVGHFKWNHKVNVCTDAELNHIRAFFFKGATIDFQFDPSNEYEVNAANMANKMGVTLSLKLLKRAKYFQSDDEDRDIYEITMVRGPHTFVFTFGQSISDTRTNTPPSIYSILACLQKYEVGTLEEFCNEFGYDSDSRKVENTYKSVANEYAEMAKMFTPDELEILSEIQ